MLLPRTRLLAWALLSVAAVRAEETVPYLDRSLASEVRIKDLLSRLTLEEKIGLIHANSKFAAGGVARLGIPLTWTDDGPDGVREEVGQDSWVPAGRTDDFATAMPVGIAMAATWNPAMTEAEGRVIGEEARARNKDVMLGPGLNIMRTPLNGRNYDYFGEDPWLTSRMTVAYVKGMQSEQVVACIKHFAANNQETERNAVDVEMSERTLREIYLPAFEAGVREGGAMAVMGAYNRFRGDFCCENDYLLNTILKKEWKFPGAVISDWNATHTTRGAVLHGLDLEMGTRGPYADYYLAKAYEEGIKNGTYSMASLDDKVRRNLRMLFAAAAIDGRGPGSINTPAHRAAALRANEEGIVLLKNEGRLLPLDPNQVHSVAVIGDNAVRTFAAGVNSAGVKTFHETTVLEGITARLHGQADITFSQGYRGPEQKKGKRDATGVQSAEVLAASALEQQNLADRAVKAAGAAEVVLFIGGLGHGAYGDDEGTDRKDLSLPGHQAELISRLVAANRRTVVVLVSGSPVEMDGWLEQVPAVVEAWYGGSTAGEGVAAVIFGDVNPSGKLPCTFPRRLKDSPAHASGLARQFPGENGVVHYDEGLLVGYRWFDTKKIQPLFPFGFGLSYTNFAYSHLAVTMGNNGVGSAVAKFDLTNTGSRAGAEVVQLYVREPQAPVDRPEKELKAFAKVFLKPGETQRVELQLGQRAFAYYSPALKAWVADARTYDVLIGSSSRDIRLQGKATFAQPSVSR